VNAKLKHEVANASKDADPFATKEASLYHVEEPLSL
jgi:hypothetical protein